jgi:hypothetical protein
MLSWAGHTVYAVNRNMKNLSFGHILLDFMKVVLLGITTFGASSNIWLAYMTSAPIGLGARVAVNILYCAHIVVAWEHPVGPAAVQAVSLFYFFVAGLFGTAALIYGIAWIKRHQWVSSVTLGGTGIEPLLLMVPARGPRYQSVGDEAREGAIRLM